jgi:hypothetical protein
MSAGTARPAIRLQGVVGRDLAEDALLQREVADALARHHVEQGPGNEGRVLHREGEQLREFVFRAGHQRVGPACFQDLAKFAGRRRVHTGCVEQPEAFHLGGVLRGIGQGDLAAHRTAARVQAGQAERLRQSPGTRGLRGRRIVSLGWMARLAKAQLVGHDDMEERGQEPRHAREVVLVGAKTMQQQQRLALPAFQIHHLQPTGQFDLLADEAGTLPLHGQEAPQRGLRRQHHEGRDGQQRGHSQPQRPLDCLAHKYE